MEYQVTVTMTPATVSALVNSGNKLYAFRVVTASDLAGRPVLWASIDFSAQSRITWTDSWTAYTSQTPIEAGRPVTIGFADPIDLGQTLKVGAGGIGQVSDDGPPGVISMLSTTTTPYTCGAGCAPDGGKATPFCAFPLYGNNLQTIKPLQTVLLIFASQTISPGTIIDDFYTAALTAYSPGYLIDLTTANQRSIQYDLNAGWSCGGCSWAATVPAGHNLVPTLIQASGAPAPQSTAAEPPAEPQKHSC